MSFLINAVNMHCQSKYEKTQLLTSVKLFLLYQKSSKTRHYLHTILCKHLSILK